MFDHLTTAQFRPRIYNDIITSKNPDLHDQTHHLAQSVKIALFEGVIETTIKSSKHIPQIHGPKRGRYRCREERSRRKIGELFIMRIKGNLVSNVLSAMAVSDRETASNAGGVEKVVRGETGSVFAQQIMSLGQRGEALRALQNIQDRHQDIVRIGRRIIELQQLFMDESVLVAMQGEILNQIELHVLLQWIIRSKVWRRSERLSNCNTKRGRLARADDIKQGRVVIEPYGNYCQLFTIRVPSYGSLNNCIWFLTKPTILSTLTSEQKLKSLHDHLGERNAQPILRNNLRVASQFHEPPEILVGWRKYDSSLDMWKLPARMTFRMEILFRATSDVDQVYCIAQILGTTFETQEIRQADLVDEEEDDRSHGSGLSEEQQSTHDIVDAGEEMDSAEIWTYSDLPSSKTTPAPAIRAAFNIQINLLRTNTPSSPPASCRRSVLWNATLPLVSTDTTGSGATAFGSFVAIELHTIPYHNSNNRMNPKDLSWRDKFVCEGQKQLFQSYDNRAPMDQNKSMPVKSGEFSPSPGLVSGDEEKLVTNNVITHIPRVQTTHMSRRDTPCSATQPPKLLHH
ncbi:hypothetical protein HK097_007156 [Rhizophlyctis rosea]|uniref:t-SNARE coiled-coil homology domain-containing protein n=1 Tax=Rhizophlyctis rosea TaxID=64517 RepID=A0AAD5SEZ1_9FUNG|nr:hypothetical protein HK097_007156 [Rhizophlyctis rosea]